LVPHRVGRGGGAVGERRLGDRRSQIRVAGRDREDVAARGREAPDREPGGVDARQGAGEGDRGPQVGVLLADPRDLPRLAAALPEVAVVEGQDREPGLVKALSEPIGSRLGAGSLVCGWATYMVAQRNQFRSRSSRYYELVAQGKPHSRPPAA
jgi:hypothetical protein